MKQNERVKGPLARAKEQLLHLTGKRRKHTHTHKAVAVAGASEKEARSDAIERMRSHVIAYQIRMNTFTLTTMENQIAHSARYRSVSTRTHQAPFQYSVSIIRDALCP